MMGKLALCINRNDAPAEVQEASDLSSQVLRDSFFNTKTFLADRAICETDEGVLQLIPYIVLRNPAGRIFCYSRGKGSDEERLRANLSVGLGGHVDEAPAGESLYGLIQREARRELQEEVGLEIHSDLCFSLLLVDPTNPVGRVHLGLLAVHNVTGDEFMSLEKDHIEDGKFIHPATISGEEFDRLENWSKVVVNCLR
jgi:predicted NUDIX family phosphoesterase